MSDLRDIAAAIAAQNRSLTSIEGHLASVDGSLVQLREADERLNDRLGAVAVAGGQQAAALHGHTQAIQQLQHEVGALADLVRGQHSEVMAALASLGARVRTEKQLMEDQARGKRQPEAR